MTASILPIILWPLIAAGFVALSWRPYRQRRFRLVGLLLAGFAIAQGYVSYRLLCSQPLSCDAGNASDYLLAFWPHYAVQAALGYGAALLFISDVQRGSDSSLSLRTVVLGVFVVLGASYIVGALLPLVWPWHQ